MTARTFGTSVIAAAVLLAGGVFLSNPPGEAWARNAQQNSGVTAADRNAADSARRVKPVRTPTSRVRASRPNYSFPIVVGDWLNGRTMRRNAMLAISFSVTDALVANPRFQVILLRGRAHTVMTTLPPPRRIGTSHTFESQWRIPADFATGNDFFFKVVHTPTRKQGFGGLFTIQ